MPGMLAFSTMRSPERSIAWSSISRIRTETIP
jgi:hypothetical protein